MIKASIDRPKLEKSLKRFAKDFGETSAQAVVRWSVQACRELATETQAVANKDLGEKPKGKQEGAIFKDSLNVLWVVDELTRTQRGWKITNRGKVSYAQNERVITDAEAVNDWIELNRTRRRGRTAKLAIQDRKICSAATHKKAMRARYKRAGMAKGGWLGAGMDIARAQKGQDRINIGKNYLGYAQKHSKYGSAVKPQEGWKPFASVTNRLHYSGDSNVLTHGGSKRAIDWSLKKTVKWYQSALRKKDKAQKA